MLWVYIGALVVAALSLVVQLATGHHGVDAADAADADHGGEAGHSDVTPLTFIASLRFWAFTLLGFGIVGAVVTVFDSADVALTASIAALVGIASGVSAVLVVRALARRTASSDVGPRDVVGRVGRVVVASSERGTCKVRVELKGSQVDYTARTGDVLAQGEAVLVEELDGEEIVVSRAPRELKP